MGRPFRFLYSLLTRSVAPPLQSYLGPPRGVMVRPNYEDVDRSTFLPQGAPKLPVSRSPGSQFGVGIIARIDVGEGGGFGSDRDGQFQGKVAGLFPHGSLIDAVGNPAAVDAQQLKETDFFLLGRKPGKLRVFQNVVEREQPPEHDGIIHIPAVPDVLNSQLAVNLFVENPTRPRSAGKDGPVVLHRLYQNSCKLLFINCLLVCYAPRFPHCTPHFERDFPAPRTPAVDRSGFDLCRPAVGAVMESFFSTLKTELADRFPSFSEAKMELFDYIEPFYNQRRRHSTLGQISPAAFERPAVA